MTLFLSQKYFSVPIITLPKMVLRFNVSRYLNYYVLKIRSNGRILKILPSKRRIFHIHDTRVFYFQSSKFSFTVVYRSKSWSLFTFFIKERSHFFCLKRGGRGSVQLSSLAFNHYRRRETFFSGKD